MFSDTSDTSNAGTIECFVKKKKRAKTLHQATDLLLHVDVLHCDAKPIRNKAGRR